jgi:flagellar biogenesis protein FliO
MDHPLFKMIIGLVFVLSLMGILALILKLSAKGRAAIGSQKRIKVTDMHVLDNRRRLVLVQKDQKEHLILLSPEGNLLIESAPLKENQKETVKLEDKVDFSFDLSPKEKIKKRNKDAF